MNSGLDKKVKAALPRLVQSVCESVRIPSLSSEGENGFPYGMNIARAADHAMTCARAMGFKVVDLDGRVCWAEYGEGTDYVAVMGHLDVVPPGDGWEFDPFCGLVKNGYILGRGTQDDKGPLFSSLYALKALADSEIKLSHRVRIIFGLDEESGRMRDVEAYLAHEKPPLFAFTPDGAYPVVNTEKGTVKFSSVLKREPSEEAEGAILASLKAGEGLGSVPAAAEAIFRGKRAALEAAAAKFACTAEKLGWPVKLSFTEGELILRTEGKAAHATLPELGINAAGRISVLINELGLSGREGQFFKMLAEKFGTESDGSSLGIKGSDPHCGKVTVNLALLSASQEEISLRCGIYIPARTADFDTVCDILKNCFTEVGASFEPTSRTAPLFYEPSHPLIRKLQTGYSNATGKKATLVSMCGSTYSKRMPNMVPYGATFDDEDDRAHGANERLLITNLLESTRLMAYGIAELAR